MAGDELETYAFSADISQLMSLIINAFYSNKEIFLRELISNASDAMDKIQYQAQTSPEKLATNPDLRIKVSVDRETRTITVEDSGIAMTRDEMVNNLGTIAKSGTKAFMEAVEAGGDISMIGQFGVGFYSSYLVSEKVQVVSKSNDDEQYVWESAAGGTFAVWKDETFEHGVLQRGTKVICFLKEDQNEFLETDRLKDLILKHSAFVEFPIELNMEYRKEEEAEPGSEEKKVTITHKWELINKNKPVWLRPAEEVSHEEYAELYKWLASDWEDHLAVKHVIQKGQIDFKALLYCPRNAPKDMFDMGKMSQRFSIRLYVRRVFIKEFNDLIPKWMGFIKGIVDSDDMPLNIGREKLQQNAILKHIQTGLQKNIFAMFTELANDRERYKVFYEAFAQCLKLGVYEDHTNRQQIIPLLRYYSTKSGDDLVSLDEYVARMKPGQKHILYVTGRSKRDAARSPYIEGLRRDGYEVLYMFDPVDEYAVQFLKEYNGNDLMSAMNANAGRLLDAGRTDADVKAELEPMRRQVAAALDGEVARVSFADGLDADTCGRVVSAEDGTLALELNFKHSLLKEMSKRKEDNETTGLARLVYEIAQTTGLSLEDPKRSSADERCKEMIMRLNAGDKDDCPDDLPQFGSQPAARMVDLGTSAKAPKDAPMLSCGSAVRIVKEERARRAIISFVDEDAGTVDVIYPMWGGGEMEEEGISVKKVRKLLDFEIEPAAATQEESFYKKCCAIKEEGNQLFKLKDFEAAHERYTALTRAFAERPRSRGQLVLAVCEAAESRRELKATTVTSVDAEGQLELSSGVEVSGSEVLPVFQELLPLQTAGHMNRARCCQNLGLHQEAAQDLTTVLALWSAADRRMLEADLEMKEAEAKGLDTAQYLRGRSRLARGLIKQAAADVRDVLARNPPPATAKQVRQLKAEVQAAQEEHRRVDGPLAKELAKIAIFLRGGPKIS